jgi:hypothetical protein
MEFGGLEGNALVVAPFERPTGDGGTRSGGGAEPLPPLIRHQAR